MPFLTHNTALAASLKEKGYRVQSSYKSSNGKYCFLFQGNEGLRETIELFWDDQLHLNARSLIGTYERLAEKTDDQRQ